MPQQNTLAASLGQPHVYTADEELDLCCDWDPARHGEGREGMRSYVEKELPHLLRAYDPEFLLNAVERSRARMQGSR